MSQRPVPAVLQSAGVGVVPTGYELLALVKRWGETMLAQPTHEKYLKAREVYIELLVYAERDAICAPILINSVQGVLDEERAAYRRKLDKS